MYYNTITIHHSGNRNNSLTIQELQSKEQDDGYADIPYHFAIDSEGNIYEGRPINIKGAHVKGKNTGNIGIVFMVDLDSSDKGLEGWRKFLESNVLGSGRMTDKMYNSLFLLTHYLNKEYGVQYFGGHNEAIPDRNCPGNLCQPLIDNLRRTFKFKKPNPNP